MLKDSDIVELTVSNHIAGITAAMDACHKYCDALAGAAVALPSDANPPAPGFIDRIEQQLIDLEKQAAELSERLDRIARRLA